MSPNTVSSVENFTRQITSHTSEPDQRDPQQVVDVGHELDRERDAGDLGDQRQQGDEERRAEVHERRARAEPLAHEVERGALR